LSACFSAFIPEDKVWPYYEKKDEFSSTETPAIKKAMQHIEEAIKKSPPPPPSAVRTNSCIFLFTFQ
jgi:hypothetical protein